MYKCILSPKIITNKIYQVMKMKMVEEEAEYIRKLDELVANFSGWTLGVKEHWFWIHML